MIFSQCGHNQDPTNYDHMAEACSSPEFSSVIEGSLLKTLRQTADLTRKFNENLDCLAIQGINSMVVFVFQNNADDCNLTEALVDWQEDVLIKNLLQIPPIKKKAEDRKMESQEKQLACRSPDHKAESLHGYSHLDVPNQIHPIGVCPSSIFPPPPHQVYPYLRLGLSRFGTIIRKRWSSAVLHRKIFRHTIPQLTTSLGGHESSNIQLTLDPLLNWTLHLQLLVQVV
ncbi:hypothetical protein PGTUg99_034024 [Puccinia graminis f. sp. tritici]|nr:hypothetical protein PGTUg99_034024 [Puccinia graminis f. sp. tritici]